MQAVMNLCARKKAQLERHPFYDWVRSDAVPLSKRFDFAPIMANFVMNFRDMNLWFIRFQKDVDAFRTIINGNTLEDETHSRLFMEDWKKLRFDEKLGWRASDTMWWLFLAPETEPFRGYGMDFARMNVEDGHDALVRFAHSEAGENCGNAFFQVVAPVATKLEHVTGTELRYFGTYHLDRERGHVIESEGVFEQVTLPDETRKKCLLLADKMFDIFFGMHDCFLSYAETYVSRGRTPKRSLPAPVWLDQPPSRPKQAEVPVEVGPLHREVQRALDVRRLITAKHPFYTWLRDSSTAPPAQKLQRFIPMWVMDIMGYRDLNHYVLRFADPSCEAERRFNAWVATLETHSRLFQADWDALGMDDVLGWEASDALEFFFLDRETDVHRRNIASFIKLALAHPKPELRFWLLEALEASGEAFFANTSVVAQAAERQIGRRLDYLADRHYLAHPRGTENVARAYPFKSTPITPEDRDTALTMVDTVFNAVDEQLSISLDVARRNRFKVPTTASVSSERAYASPRP